MLQIFIFQINAVLLNFLFIKKNLKKKIYSAVFIIHNNNNNNNNKCILSSKSEYLNDFWTSCDWSNDAENSALITGINYILKYILNIKNISQYYCFCCILDQTNTSLVNRRDFFKKKKKKILLFKNFWMVVYIIYLYILYGGGGGPPGPKNARADFLSQSSPGWDHVNWMLQRDRSRWGHANTANGTRPREPDESSAQSDLCCNL